MKFGPVSKAILSAAIRTALEEVGKTSGNEVNIIHVALRKIVQYAPRDEEAVYLAACVLWLFGARAKMP